MASFHYQAGILHAEKLPLDEIAAQVGTPFYCYSMSDILTGVQHFTQAFKQEQPLIFYAMKANSNQAILRLLADEGLGMDIVSEGEMRRALAAGVCAKKIIFSGVGKTDREISAALDANIFCFNIESEPELYRISALAQAREVIASVSVRINPDLRSRTHQKIATGALDVKFGIDWKEAERIYALIADLPAVNAIGIDMHIGSQIHMAENFSSAFDKICELTLRLQAAGHAIKYIDLGGGLGIAYKTDDKILDMEIYARLATKVAQKTGCQLIFEPGRRIVGNAGVLVSEVIYYKQNEVKNFVIVDAAMNDLLRPTLYNAHHEILPVRESDSEEYITADVVGPICESGDYLALDRKLAPVVSGDLLAFTSAGAYGAVLSSGYNSRPLVPEVLVEGDKFHIIRPRPDMQAIIDADSVPHWLSNR